MLDWTKPGKSIVVCAAGVFFVFVVHFFCYCLYCLRVWLYAQVCLPETSSSVDNLSGGSGSTRKTLGSSREKISSITRTLSSMEESQREQFLNPSTIIDLK